MLRSTKTVQPLNQRVFRYYRRLARVKEYVEGHYAEPLSLPKMAEIARLETTYFSKFFRQKTGMRYHDWLSQTRVQHAVQIMSSQDTSITEIAFAVGFQNLRTFERAFKKYVGVAPRSFRKEVRPEYGSGVHIRPAYPKF